MPASEAISQVKPAQARLSRWKKLGLVLLLLLVAFGVFAWLRPLALVRAAGRLTLWRGGIHSHYAQVGGYRIHYYEGGEGPPLVFVHGLGAESLNWVPAMLDMRHQFHVYAIDLLGHGDSQKPDIAYSIEQQSEMLRQFLATQNIKSADVVGVSMGGWVALKLAIEHPEVVNRLVVADAAGLKFQTDITVKNFLPATPEEFAAFMAMLTPRQYPTPYPVRRDFLHQVAEHAWITRRIFDSFLTYQDVLDGKLGNDQGPRAGDLGKAGEADSAVGRRGDETATAERVSAVVLRLGPPGGVRVLEQARTRCRVVPVVAAAPDAVCA